MTQQQFFNTSRHSRANFEEVRTLKISEERLNQAGQRRGGTMKFSAEQLSRPPVVWRKTTSNTEAVAENFVVLPHGTTSRIVPRWLIQLSGLTPRMRPVGIELASDVVLGLVRSLESRPDLDFDLFGGVEMGVSRRHAMLRPSADKLYLIDLRSTNGTRINGVPLEPGVPCPVAHGDLISLGLLTFTLQIAATPDEIVRATGRRM